MSKSPRPALAAAPRCRRAGDALGTHGKHSRPYLAVHRLLLLDRVEGCGLEAGLERVQEVRHMVHFGLPVCESAARSPLLCLGINKSWGCQWERNID